MRPGCFAERHPAGTRRTRSYRARVWNHEGELLYDGRLPIPEDVEVLTPEDVAAGRWNRYEVTEE